MVLVLGILLGFIATIFIFSVVRFWRIFSTDPTNKKMLSWFVLLLVTGVLFAVLMGIIGIIHASAAENPAPAPAKSVITVKGYTSCPTEFNPDDLGWAMHDIAEPELKKFGEDVVLVEHRRIFSYFPDAEQRIFVGMKEWKNPACVAELFSYGSTSKIDQKRVWGVIRSTDGTAKIITVFLLTEKGWERGGNGMPEASLVCGAEQCKIIFALHRDKSMVASRALPVEPIKHFFKWHPEPVE